MTQAARDLRTPLDWVVVDHYDTAHPHSHIVIRGVDAAGGDLVIAREYIEHGFQQRAAALVALDLDPNLKPEHERQRGRGADIALERPTGIDQDLLASMDEQGRVSPDHADRWGQAERAGRLRILETLGLAHADGQGRWFIQPDLIERLGEIEWRNRLARAPSRLAPEFDVGEGETIASTDARVHTESAAGSVDRRNPASNLDMTDSYFAALGQDSGREEDGIAGDRGQRMPRQKDRTLDPSAFAVTAQRGLVDRLHLERAPSPIHLPDGLE